MKFAVVGGGIGGLVITYRLVQKGHIVKLFEKTDILGGQARTTKVDGKNIEVYYHHYDTTHTALFSLCKELGVNITWFDAPMGFLSNGKVYDFNTPIDLLKFRPLKFRDKANFVLSHYFSMGESQAVYNTIWKPLLQHKFGPHYVNIPMTYIYSRPKANGKLAYIEGSTQTLIDKLQDTILQGGGKIVFGEEIDKDLYTAVIDTTPNIKDTLSITCLMLVLDRPFTKYYWLNVADMSFPFGLVVQKDNIIYIPRYGEAKGDCIEHLNRINPDFNESWIKEAHVFKDDYIQPIDVKIEERGLDKIIRKAEKTVLYC